LLPNTFLSKSSKYFSLTHTPQCKSRFISYYSFPFGLYYIDHAPINSPFL
jgi:hypothetical protein